MLRMVMRVWMRLSGVSRGLKELSSLKWHGVAVGVV